MKKFVSVLLALAMTLALSVSALAAGETGSITIDNAVKDQTYTIYRIFDLNDHNTDYSAINYKVSTKWAGFFQTGAEGLNYVDIDDMGYVTWKADKKDAASLQAFAAAALAYAKDHSVVNDGAATATGSEVKFENLELGYYLVQSGLGTLCALDTNMPNVTIKEKNGEPTVDKEVQEGANWGKTNDANIGDTVNFQTTINVVDGDPKDYVLHDTMSEGLTFNGTVEVTVNGTKITTGYQLVNPGTNGCTFDVVFTNGTLKPNDVVVVTYSATVNSSAVVAGTGNPNETKLSYTDTNSESHDTTPSVTRTYTWQVDVFKYTKNGEKEVALKDAEFVLYRGTGDNKEYVIVTDGKVSGWTTEKTQATVFKTPENGKFSIVGLDAGTYYLEETKAPAGYNMLKDPIKVVITAIIDETTHAGTATITYNETYTGEVKVENNTGTELPSTGGMGTTIFYVLGGVLMAGAFVLLVVRKRMRTE